VLTLTLEGGKAVTATSALPSGRVRCRLVKTAKIPPAFQCLMIMVPGFLICPIR